MDFSKLKMMLVPHSHPLKASVHSTEGKNTPGLIFLNLNFLAKYIFYFGDSLLTLSRISMDNCRIGTLVTKYLSTSEYKHIKSFNIHLDY